MIQMISLLLASVEGESNVIATSVVTSAEQVNLLLIFITNWHSRKGYSMKDDLQTFSFQKRVDTKSINMCYISSYTL